VDPVISADPPLRASVIKEVNKRTEMSPKGTSSAPSKSAILCFAIPDYLGIYDADHAP